MNHPTVTCRFFGEQVAIDEEIAPLVRSTWELRCLTSSSCQGDDEGKWPHLGFADEHHLLRWLSFVSAVAPEDDREEGDGELGFSKLYHRIAPWEGLTHSHPGRWRYSCRVLREWPGGRPYIEAFVDFPRSDIPALEALLARAVQEHRGEGDDESDGPPEAAV